MAPILNMCLRCCRDKTIFSILRNVNPTSRLRTQFVPTSQSAVLFPLVAASRWFSSGNVVFRSGKPRSAQEDFVLDLTEPQKQEILGVLNEYKKTDLSLVKGLGLPNAELIVKYREKNGPFKSVDELKNITGFRAISFLKKIQSQDGKLVMKKRKSPSYAEILTKQERDNIQTMISIDINYGYFTWIHLTRDLEVLEWAVTENPYEKPYSPLQCAQQVRSFVSSLPQADIHILELQSHRFSSTAEVSSHVLSYVLRVRVLEAMLYALLFDNLVISIKPIYVHAYFHLTNGNKKKGVESVVDSFFKKLQDPDKNDQDTGIADESTGQTSLKNSGNVLKKVKVPQNLIERYRMAGSKKSEFSDCLLQALYFVNDAKLLEID